MGPNQTSICLGSCICAKNMKICCFSANKNLIIKFLDFSLVSLKNKEKLKVPKNRYQYLVIIKCFCFSLNLLKFWFWKKKSKTLSKLINILSILGKMIWWSLIMLILTLIAALYQETSYQMNLVRRNIINLLDRKHFFWVKCLFSI